MRFFKRHKEEQNRIREFLDSVFAVRGIISKDVIFNQYFEIYASRERFIVRSGGPPGGWDVENEIFTNAWQKSFLYLIRLMKRNKMRIKYIKKRI